MYGGAGAKQHVHCALSCLAAGSRRHRTARGRHHGDGVVVVVVVVSGNDEVERGEGGGIDFYVGIYISFYPIIVYPTYTNVSEFCINPWGRENTYEISVSIRSHFIRNKSDWSL